MSALAAWFVSLVLLTSSVQPPIPCVATYYGIDDGFGPTDTMANGQPFDPHNTSIAASSVWPLGTLLAVEHEGQAILVVVQDQCPACTLDLSWAAFELLAPHGAGVISVTVHSGCSSVRQSTWPGTRGSEVRFLSP